MTKPNSNLKVAVGTTKKSTEAMPSAWYLGHVFQDCEGRRTALDQIVGHGRLRHSDTDLQELAVDPRYAPEGIGTVDLADQISDFLVNPWPAGSTSRFQPPERLEAVPVPAHHRLVLDDNDRA